MPSAAMQMNEVVAVPDLAALQGPLGFSFSYSSITTTGNHGTSIYSNTAAVGAFPGAPLPVPSLVNKQVGLFSRPLSTVLVARLAGRGVPSAAAASESNGAARAALAPSGMPLAAQNSVVPGAQPAVAPGAAGAVPASVPGVADQPRPPQGFLFATSCGGSKVVAPTGMNSNGIHGSVPAAADEAAATPPAAPVGTSAIGTTQMKQQKGQTAALGPLLAAKLAAIHGKASTSSSGKCTAPDSSSSSSAEVATLTASAAASSAMAARPAAITTTVMPARQTEVTSLQCQTGTVGAIKGALQVSADADQGAANVTAVAVDNSRGAPVELPPVGRSTAPAAAAAKAMQATRVAPMVRVVPRPAPNWARVVAPCSSAGAAAAAGRAAAESADATSSPRLDQQGDDRNGGSGTSSLPLRPCAANCAVYMLTGRCCKGASCEYHHPPDPELPLSMALHGE